MSRFDVFIAKLQLCWYLQQTFGLCWQNILLKLRRPYEAEWRLCKVKVECGRDSCILSPSRCLHTLGPHPNCGSGRSFERLISVVLWRSQGCCGQTGLCKRNAAEPKQLVPVCTRPVCIVWYQLSNLHMEMRTFVDNTNARHNKLCVCVLCVLFTQQK